MIKSLISSIGLLQLFQVSLISHSSLGIPAFITSTIHLVRAGRCYLELFIVKTFEEETPV